MCKQCKDCPTRWVDGDTATSCHDECQIYISDRILRDEIIKKRAEESNFMGGLTEAIRRCKADKRYRSGVMGGMTDE